ncbi:hypothetical protein BJX61DRAFT_541146 [Aspergillus egyptiacus]|nr:hypothetical protein BJX61DRAFT_541146 [Aspergillus egyptiacus]
MYLRKAILSPAILFSLSAAISLSEDLSVDADGSTAKIAADIITADESAPESSYSINPTQVETGAPIPTTSQTLTPIGSVTITQTATTTSIPTDILTAPDTEPTGIIASMSTLIATTTLSQPHGASTSASPDISPSPTPTGGATTGLVRDTAPMLGAALLAVAMPWL